MRQNLSDKPEDIHVRGEKTQERPPVSRDLCAARRSDMLTAYLQRQRSSC